jgi:hypothetical protein
MKEQIQSSGDEVSIVIYDNPLPPKYFRLNKRFIKSLFVVTPVILILIFISLFLWGLGARFKSATKPNFRIKNNDQENQLAVLKAEITQLQQSNNSLTEKLSAQPSATGVDEPFLMAIKRPYGMQNLISKNLVSADQFNFSKEAGNLSLKFQIISTTPENKVTGHIHVFMVSNSGVMAYPNAANQFLAEGIKYSVGEPFAVARLRPTNAIFPQQITADKVKFVVYIFSREGDLLLVKETQSFENGTKK